MKKIKILFITQEFSNTAGGAGVYAYELSRALAETNRAEVHVLAPGKDNDEHIVQKNLVLHTVKTINKPFLNIPSFHFQVYGRSREIIGTKGIDTIHSNQNAGLMALGLRPSIVVVHHPVVKEQEHTTLTQNFVNFPDVIMERIAMRRADIVSVDCRKIQEMILEFVPRLRDKIIIAPLGINTSTYFPHETIELRRSLNIDDKTKIIFFPGGARAKRKGTINLIRALMAIKSPENFVCVVSGSSREMGWNNELEDVVRHSGISNHFIWVKEINYDSIPDYFALADFIVYPSLFEGFGLPVLESMAVGKPVIATKTGIAPEILRDRQNGILIDTDDISALTEAIDTLLNSKSETERLGLAALETVKRGYTWDYLANDTINQHIKLTSKNAQ